MPAAPTMGGTVVVSVAGVNYQCDPGPSQDAYDRKYTEVLQANGTRFNVVDYAEGDSECKWNLTKFLEDSDMPLLTACGLGATVGLPTDTAVIYRLPQYTRTILHAMANDVELTFEHGKNVLVAINGMATQAPADTAGFGGTAPTVTNGNLLYFKDLLIFFTKAAVAAPCRKFSVKLDHQLFAFFGVRADGLCLPTSLTPTTPKVTGSIDKLMVDDADYLLYLAACQLKADVGLTAASFCGATPKTLTITAKNCLYTKPSRAGSTVEAIVETFPYMATNPLAANPLVVTMA
jgi:tail tube protein